MKNNQLFKLATLIVILFHGIIASSYSAPVMVDGFQVHATRILARYRAGDAMVQSAAILNQQGLALLDQSQLVPGLVTFDLADVNAVAGVAAQPVEAQQKALLRRIDALKTSGFFEYVEPDYILKALAVPTDTAFTNGTLWGLRNTGQSNGVSGVDIGAVAAWDITTGSTNVIVAVIDTGIRYTHQDLVGQMWVNPGEIPGNGIDDDSNGYVDDVYGINAIVGSGDPFDDNNHGTHCAGTIGASANSGGPHVGVTWKVRLMGCKFLDAGGSGASSDAIRCIDYATVHGARIMNNSWGGGGFSQAMFDSIFAARNAGVIFLAAAGNNTSDNDVFPAYPAGYQIDNIVSVAAIDRTGALANFSNYGRNSVHLGAPGVAIYSSTAASDTSYASFNGTSMATPHVAGIAALLKTQFPASSVAEIKQRLLAGIVPTPSLVNTITGGRANALNSLTIAADGILEIAANPPNGAAIASGTNVVVRVTVTDLLPVTNATVTAVGPGGTNYVFLNNGAAPDITANDHIYSRNIPIPGDATNLALTILVTAPGKQPSTNNVTYPFVVRPPNDDFINRIVLAGSTNSTTANNSNATKEASEPLHAGNSGGKSLWWSWTAPSNGVVVVDTIGSNFDTILGVYTGTNVSNLTVVASDDDSGGNGSSRVIFNVIAGIIYQIAVDGFSGSSGQIQLHVGIGGGGPAITLPEAVDAPHLTWTTGGNAGWFGQASTTHDTVDAARSGAITHSQESWMQTTVTGPGALTFWWKVSSESSFDFLEFYIDGVLQPGRITGEINWQQQTFAIPSGSHTLRWRYTKDVIISAGQDAAWVDQVTFTAVGSGSIVISNSPTAVPYPATFAISNVVGSVTKVTVTLNNLSHTWPDDLDIMLTGPTGQKVMLLSDAGGGSSFPLSNVTLVFDDAAPGPPPQGSQIVSATYRPIDYEPGESLPNPAPAAPYSTALSVFNGINPNGIWSLYVADDFPAADNGSIGSWSVSVTTGAPGVTLPEALDATNLTWTTGGSASWIGQTATTHDGVDAGKSGFISDSQESWMQTTVTGPGQLSFWWKVSSESSFDYLEFYIDNVLQAGRISGEVNWQQKTFNLATGSRTLRWRYLKDGSVSTGMDAGWVDQVSIAPVSPGAVTIDAADSGWYDVNGVHNANNKNYLVGNAESGTASPFRNWFVFNIPAVDAVTSAELRLNTYTIVTADPSETYELRHVSTPVSTLTAGGTGLVGIYNDLADGTVYGSRTFAPSNSNQYLSIPLNAQCISNILAAAGTAFAMGGNITTLDANLATQESLFGFSLGNPADIQLVLQSPVSNQPPSIVTQPQSQTVGLGETAAFNVVATGEAPFFYQWRFFGTNLPGATSSSLSVTNVQPSNAGLYSVLVSNTFGSTLSSNAAISLLSGNLHMGLAIHGPVGGNYRIDFQTDAGAAWQTLTNIVLPGSPYLYVDPTPANTSRRFYRAVHLP